MITGRLNIGFQHWGKVALKGPQCPRLEFRDGCSERHQHDTGNTSKVTKVMSVQLGFKSMPAKPTDNTPDPDSLLLYQEKNQNRPRTASLLHTQGMSMPVPHGITVHVQRRSLSNDISCV